MSPIIKLADDAQKVLAEISKRNKQVKAKELQRMMDEQEGPQYNLIEVIKALKGSDQQEEWMDPYDRQIFSMIRQRTMAEMMSKVGTGSGESSGGVMKDLMQFAMIKMMMKPDATEMAIMQTMANASSKGEEIPAWMQSYLEEQKQSRQLLSQMIEGQKEMVQSQKDERWNQLIQQQAQMIMALGQQSQEGFGMVLKKIEAGEQAGAGSLEVAISQAIKDQVTNFVTDRIASGFMERAEVVKPEGGIDWGAALNRMFSVAEKAIEKMPGKAPAMRPIQQADGTFRHPLTGEVMAGPPGLELGAPAPLGLPLSPAGLEAPPTRLPPEARDKDLQRRSKDLASDLVTLGATKTAKEVSQGESATAEQPPEEES